MILEVREIHTYYGDSYILQGISLQIPDGAVIAVLGRNGVGKTTLIRTIIGFTPARTGEVIFKGFDVTHLAPNQISNLGIGLIPQGHKVFPSLTTRENLLVVARGGTTVRWTLERIFDLFPSLKDRSSHAAGKLSGGEQQMLNIARCLMRNPDLLLMDEPTAGIAPLLVAKIRNVVQTLREEGLSILLVEQNLNFALDRADYVYVMTNGRMTYESSPGELRQNEEAKRLYLGV